MDPKNWTFVLTGPCPECGYDGSTVSAEDTPARMRAEVAGYRSRLARESLVTRRPDPTTWSALEYGCHVRDACATLTERANLILTKDEPTFVTWDEDASAVDDRYNEQDPAKVVYQLAVNAGRAADTFDHVHGAKWQRAGVRSGDGQRFTLDDISRYLLHEMVHHLHDIDAGYEKLTR
jgi:hypothetical protein